MVTDNKEQEVPKEFRLRQDFPDPFNPTTTIKCDLPISVKVTMRVYDILGREVMRQVNEIVPAGYHEAAINARGLSSGIYFYRIEAGTFARTRKMTILK